MKYCCFLLLLVCFATGLFAQKENNVWAFGNFKGIDFNSGKPVSIKTSLSTREGCASLCDSNGNLLLYSDGHRVWTRDNKLIPSGAGLLGNQYESSTQGVGILPWIMSKDKYYVFVLDSHEAGWEGGRRCLRYNVVDFSKNGGLGEVTVKNVILDSLCSEKMVFAKGNGCFNWLIVHDYRAPVFRAFKIGPEGIDPTPYISYSGNLAVGDTGRYATGEMKINAAFNQIGLLANDTDTPFVELHRFNNTTGKIDDYQLLDTFCSPGELYSICFSPNDSVLYCSYNLYGERSFIKRYDLGLLPYTDSVRKSAVTYSFPDTRVLALGGIRMGPDSVLYIAKVLLADTVITTHIAAIRNADRVTPAIDVLENTGLVFEFPLGSEWERENLGLGNPVLTLKTEENVHYFDIDLGSDDSLCTMPAIELKANVAQAAYLWQDGSVAPGFKVNDYGTYWLQASVGYCVSADTVHFYRKNFPVDLGEAYRNLCKGDSLNLIPGISGTYLWQDGSTAAMQTIWEPGTYWLTVTENNCSGTDTVRVSNADCSYCFSIPNAFTPNGDHINDYFSPIFHCVPDAYTLAVMNRWGQEVFRSDNPSEPWRGTFNGVQASSGVYYYLVKVKFRHFSGEEVYKGDVTLIR